MHLEIAQSNSSMHHYKCVALCKDISLQRSRFCAKSLVSYIPRSSEDRSSWMFFIQVVRSCRGDCLQVSGRSSKMAWLAPAFSSIRARCPKKVRWQDLMMDESGGWLVMRRMSAFLTKSCQRMSRILRRHHWYTASNLLYIRLVNCSAFRSTQHYLEYEDPVQMEFGLEMKWVKICHCKNAASESRPW